MKFYVAKPQQIHKMVDVLTAEENITPVQIKIVKYVTKNGKITNKEYQKLFKVSDRTALRELSALVKKKILKKQGKTGKNTFYQLAKRKIK